MGKEIDFMKGEVDSMEGERRGQQNYTWVKSIWLNRFVVGSRSKEFAARRWKREVDLVSLISDVKRLGLKRKIKWGYFGHLEKCGGNGFQFHQMLEGMVKSLREGISKNEFHSIANQTRGRNLVNGIDHSNSVQFRRIPANQTAP